MRHLSEGDQCEEAAEANREEEPGHPADPRLLGAPRQVARRVHSGQLVRPVVQPQQERPEPCTRSSPQESHATGKLNQTKREHADLEQARREPRHVPPSASV